MFPDTLNLQHFLAARISQAASGKQFYLALVSAKHYLILAAMASLTAQMATIVIPACSSFRGMETMQISFPGNNMDINKKRP